MFSMIRRVLMLPTLCTGGLVYAADPLPTGRLRAVCLATNPVQARVDRAIGETHGPAAELAEAIARELRVPLALRAVPGTSVVSAEVKTGRADIVFLAFDPLRAQEVDFSQTYLLAHNSYAVNSDSPIRRVADADRAGVRIGVGAADAADLFLTRTLRQAELRRYSTASLPDALGGVERGEIEAYGANRTRLLDALDSRPGLRLLEDNFLSVRQAVIVARGNVVLLEAVNRVIVVARAAGLIADAIELAGLRGVDPAPAPRVEAEPAP